MFGFFKKPVIFSLCLQVKITLFSKKLFYSVQAINLTLNVHVKALSGIFLNIPILSKKFNLTKCLINFKELKLLTLCQKYSISSP